MAQSCNTDDLVAASKCFNSCIPDGMQQAIQTYLLNVISGLNYTPDQLMNAAKCFRCADGMQQEIQTYLLCQILNK